MNQRVMRTKSWFGRGSADWILRLKCTHGKAFRKLFDLLTTVSSGRFVQQTLVGAIFVSAVHENDRDEKEKPHAKLSFSF